ncbi:hypothetical protein ABB37_04289 [Leptomonas pyrrhocoris]|uniref:Uncharacterized protein n=1 Tax=Leptomonas pyrrhocoris TaxID=157538 RepID=A0A0M9G2H6_LEPPY|nr:hypothetical protein ABB37_04289 [Leptomonas pyrrhocoris]KPA80877.1 hypothetical protein ABB37_04289 [Leptomonas pyrrhocoris]|eukprot:XP_015659316.1 hypothetical protein ABB37_04289 [Leptomonas pyrrhocoris]
MKLSVLLPPSPQKVFWYAFPALSPPLRFFVSCAHPSGYTHAHAREVAFIFYFLYRHIPLALFHYSAHFSCFNPPPCSTLSSSSSTSQNSYREFPGNSLYEAFETMRRANIPGLLEFNVSAKNTTAWEGY